MQQRYYDPGIGRFLSVDPVTADGNSGGNFNRYWYANNNPYRFTDPDGRAVLDDLKREWTAGGGSSCGLRSCFPSLGKKKEGRQTKGGAAEAGTAAGVARPVAGTGGGSWTGVGSLIRGLLGRAVITAPLVIGGDSRKAPTIVIGEGMVERVIPYAASARAEYYMPPPAPPEM